MLMMIGNARLAISERDTTLDVPKRFTRRTLMSSTTSIRRFRYSQCRMTPTSIAITVAAMTTCAIDPGVRIRKTNDGTPIPATIKATHQGYPAGLGRGRNVNGRLTVTRARGSICWSAIGSVVSIVLIDTGIDRFRRRKAQYDPA